MIYLALKTWFQTYGVLLKLLMIDIRYGVSHIGDNNVSPFMYMQEACNQEEMYILQSVLWHSLMLRLMRSDELYKFSDGMLTRLLSSLEDITKNIDMEYFPKRRWSNLEKKRAYFMIKDINKLLKEIRMMRSLEKFVDGRLYGTDLRLLQRTI
ncbi:hypothetical protein Tco_0490369 [Tanacetum coccineum]